MTIGGAMKEGTSRSRNDENVAVAHEVSGCSTTGSHQSVSKRKQRPYSDLSASETELRDRMEFVDIDVEDDEDGAVGHCHDQLPSVEEVKARVRLEKEQQAERRPKNLFLLLGVGVLCLGSFITLIVLVRNNQQYKKAVASITTRVRVSHPDALDDPLSPQSQALTWMLHQDPLRLPLPLQPEDPFVQRYIIAVLVFAVAPSKETRQAFGLLSGEHECLWNSEWKRADDDHALEGVRMGILCRHEGYDSDKDEEWEATNGEFHMEESNPTVKAIVMRSAGLVGEIPPEIESLHGLEKLALDGNKIQGTMPVMPYLRYLSLAHNELTGYLPTHFSDMTRLTTFSMSENALQGSLPKSFAALTQLQLLALDGNELTGGLANIYQLSNLEEIYLAYNSFDDQLSNGSFGKMPKLRVVDMKSNRLSGPLPDALWSMTNLEVVDFHQNALDGHINDVIVRAHPLQYLDISSNVLGGELPPSFQNFGSLTHLDLSYNRFEVILPNYLANMTHMKTLMLTEAGMFEPQPLPNWLRRMTDLENVSFRLTLRTGSIPTWFGELTRLELLDLDWNHLDGTIPNELSRLTRLKYLMLNRNLMNGKIPTEVSGLPNLRILMVDNNRFYGDLDACHVSYKLSADCGDPDYGCPDCDSDTQLVSCPCCTGCCYENAERCNMQDWAVDVEEEFRSSYDHFGYDFDDVKYVASA
jgi:Leucine-rich repeat (LRR) protein